MRCSEKCESVIWVGAGLGYSSGFFSQSLVSFTRARPCGHAARRPARGSSPPPLPRKNPSEHPNPSTNRSAKEGDGIMRMPKRRE